MVRGTIRIVFFVLFLVLIVGFVAPTATRAPAAGPYQSALSRGAGGIQVAKHNCNSYCEFIAPGYHCLNEGVREKCVTGTGGCTTVACP